MWPLLTDLLLIESSLLASTVSLGLALLQCSLIKLVAFLVMCGIGMLTFASKSVSKRIASGLEVSEMMHHGYSHGSITGDNETQCDTACRCA